MTRLMYDAVTVNNVPAYAAMCAAYVDGDFDNYNAMRRRFPDARIIQIATRKDTRGADVYDVETGDINPGDVPDILRRERASGFWPSVYCDMHLWSTVIDRIQTASLEMPPFWIASYDSNPTIPAGAVAKQYATGSYDISSVAPYWRGVDPTPTTPAPVAADQEKNMYIITVDRLLPPGVTTWPGNFLLTADGTLHHIVTTADLTNFTQAGLKNIDVTYAQYLELTAK